MTKINHFDLDGHTLRLFLTVLELGSVTAAADRLGLTQSAVSHTLQKLRLIVRDPLFVKSGRGIIATAHARELADQARAMLEAMQQFSVGSHFDPAQANIALTIAANDLQRDLLLPRLMERLERTCAKMKLRIIPSDHPTADLLRDNRCDLLLSPFPPTGIDIIQKRLFQDRYVCFFDATARAEPASLSDYLAADHITVLYPNNVKLGFDKAMEDAGIKRNFTVSVSGFSAVPSFLRGTTRLATVPSLLAASLMRDFAHCPVPRRTAVKANHDLNMFMAWHRRNATNPEHAFIRDQLFAISKDQRGRH